MVIKRSPTRTESAEVIRSLAADIRQIASALESLHARADSFSKPVYDAGWKFPIASMVGFGKDLEDWADALDTMVEPDGHAAT
jgi:hypothetical protein